MSVAFLPTTVRQTARKAVVPLTRIAAVLTEPRLPEVPPRGEGVASYLVTLGILIAVFIPILFTLANGGVQPLINNLNNYLNSVTFP